jgi:branched-chain amino acid transport system permease protein
VLVMVVLGGMGSISGVIVGALALYFVVYYLIPGLPQNVTNLAGTLGLSDSLAAAISDATTRVNFIIYGLILVGMMLLRPQGILPSRVREQELKHAAVQEDEAAVEAAN